LGHFGTLDTKETGSENKKQKENKSSLEEKIFRDTKANILLKDGIVNRIFYEERVKNHGLDIEWNV